MKKKWRFIIGSGIISIVLFVLIYQGLNRSMMAYLEVGELLQKRQNLTAITQVSGIVQPGSIESDPTGRRLSFILQDQEHPDYSILVKYRGMVPDNFRPGLQVVVQGRIVKDTTFEAHKILTKCPSKYNTGISNQS